MNAVVTVCIGDFFRRIARLTHPPMRKYAERLGADFVVLDRMLTAEKYPHYEKFRIRDLLDDYARAAYIDTDALVRNDCPDLFAEVPPAKLGAFPEGSHVDRTAAVKLACEQYGLEYARFRDKPYFNTGVMVVSRCHARAFVKPAVEVRDFWEQSYLNLRFVIEDVEMHELSHRFNRLPAFDYASAKCCVPIDEPRLDSWIVHHAGGIKAGVISRIACDLAAWRARGLA